MAKRIIYGLLAGVSVIFVVSCLPLFLSKCLITLIAIGGIYEFHKAAEKMGHNPVKLIPYLSCAVLLFIGKVPTAEIYKWVGVSSAIIVIILLIYAFFIRRRSLIDICLTFFSMIYITFLLTFLVQIIYLNAGKYLLWFVLLGACGTDIFAYFVGTKLGKHKLCPKVSPKKTVEGAIGGILGCIILFIAYAAILNNYGVFCIRYSDMVLFGTAVSIVSQLGDLVASSIKRSAGIKDFGTILPEHGGVLDRIDSILFAAPICYYCFILFPNMIQTL